MTATAVLVGEILGPDLLVILGIVVLLFGGSQLPKLARSLGSARREFERGVQDGAASDGRESQAVTAPQPAVMTKDEVERLLRRQDT